MMMEEELKFSIRNSPMAPFDHFKQEWAPPEGEKWRCGKSWIFSLEIHLWREKSDDGGRVGDEAEDTEGREENALAPKLKLLPDLWKIF